MSTVNVIVETPKNSAQKYDYDQKTGYFKLNKLMPAGMVFPFDFGFIEGTIGEDGDPLDIIVLSEIKTFPGCAIDCRIIGAIKARQKERNGTFYRNDRYIGIPEVSTQFAYVKEIKDLSADFLEQIEIFFANYNSEAGKKFEVVSHESAKNASQMVRKATIKDEVATKLIQIFLPVVDENGSPFPNRFFVQVKNKLSEKFDGLSVYTHALAEGYWKNERSSLEKDKLLVYEVMANEVDLNYWKNFRTSLEKQFKQELIVVRCLGINLI
jgi:inorganic pyrophosphatase